MAPTISIHDDVLARFPNLCVAAFVTSDLGKARGPQLPESAQRHWTQARAALEVDCATPEGVLGIAEVAAWRAAASQQRLPPAKYRSSVEALIRRCLKGDAVDRLQPVVATYCAVSARFRVPIGAYDLDRVPDDDITVRPINPNDRFAPIGYQPGQLPADAPVVVYAAGTTVLSWAFNHRDSLETCLKPYTSSAIFIGEVIAPARRPALADAMNSLREVLTGNGVDAGPVQLADAASPCMSL